MASIKFNYEAAIGCHEYTIKSDLQVTLLLFMGYSVKITGYSKADEQVLMEIEPHWWSAQDLLRDGRFIKSQNGRRYSDYNADLSLDEMRELHDRYKNNVTSIHKFLCFRFKRFSPPCRELHDALHRRSHTYSRFQVNVFEWESGL